MMVSECGMGFNPSFHMKLKLFRTSAGCININENIDRLETEFIHKLDAFDGLKPILQVR